MQTFIFQQRQAVNIKRKWDRYIEVENLIPSLSFKLSHFVEAGMAELAIRKYNIWLRELHRMKWLSKNEMFVIVIEILVNHHISWEKNHKKYRKEMCLSYWNFMVGCRYGFTVKKNCNKMFFKYFVVLGVVNLYFLNRNFCQRNINQLKQVDD